MVFVRELRVLNLRSLIWLLRRGVTVKCVLSLAGPSMFIKRFPIPESSCSVRIDTIDIGSFSFTALAFCTPFTVIRFVPVHYAIVYFETLCRAKRFFTDRAENWIVSFLQIAYFLRIDLQWSRLRTRYSSWTHARIEKLIFNECVGQTTNTFRLWKTSSTRRCAWKEGANLPLLPYDFRISMARVLTKRPCHVKLSVRSLSNTGPE